MSTPRDSLAESIRQITPGESLSSGNNHEPKVVSKKRLKTAVENLSWKESYFIKTTRLKGKYNEGSRTKRLFDKFCWTCTLLFFLREPNITTFERYMEIFASHVTHDEIPDSSNNFDNLTDIQVCNRKYFIE
jgi:hypothetical protein